MALGKRFSKDEPLTEHDLADRLDKAALRVLRIMMDIRQIGGDELIHQVVSSRYSTNMLNALRAEMDEWKIKSIPLKEGR